jgi:hypothetical protein
VRLNAAGSMAATIVAHNIYMMSTAERHLWYENGPDPVLKTITFVGHPHAQTHHNRLHSTSTPAITTGSLLYNRLTTTRRASGVFVGRVVIPTFHAIEVTEVACANRLSVRTLGEVRHVDNIITTQRKT